MIHAVLTCRDEGARLPALAEALAPLGLGRVVMLVDDRTTDDTMAVAEALWGEQLVAERFTFEDFAQARNLTLNRARWFTQPEDYLLLLDPDSLPQGELPADDELSADAYTCEWRWNGEVWPRVILLRSGAIAEWQGAVHETLSVQGLQAHLPAAWVDAVVTAGPERLAWMADVLARDAATNPRSAFYLAQTYADLGRRDEALCWYLRRAAMGHGWAEETWLATLMAGRLAEPLDWEWGEKLWRRCIEMRPRAEAPYELARAAFARGDHSEALSWASLGLRMGRSPDALRVNRWIESQGLSQLFDAATQGLLGLSPSSLEPANG